MNHNQGSNQPNPESSLSLEALKPFYVETERLLDGVVFDTDSDIEEFTPAVRVANFTHPLDDSDGSEVELTQHMLEASINNYIDITTLDHAVSDPDKQLKVFKQQTLSVDSDFEGNIFGYDYREASHAYIAGKYVPTPEELERKQISKIVGGDWRLAFLATIALEEEREAENPVMPLDSVLDNAIVAEMLSTLSQIDVSTRTILAGSEIDL